MPKTEMRTCACLSVGCVVISAPDELFYGTQSRRNYSVCRRHFWHFASIWGVILVKTWLEATALIITLGAVLGFAFRDSD
jgi:hypothetical protein